MPPPPPGMIPVRPPPMPPMLRPPPGFIPMRLPPGMAPVSTMSTPTSVPATLSTLAVHYPSQDPTRMGAVGNKTA